MALNWCKKSLGNIEMFSSYFKTAWGGTLAIGLSSVFAVAVDVAAVNVVAVAVIVANAVNVTSNVGSALFLMLFAGVVAAINVGRELSTKIGCYCLLVLKIFCSSFWPCMILNEVEPKNRHQIKLSLVKNKQGRFKFFPRNRSKCQSDAKLSLKRTKCLHYVKLKLWYFVRNFKYSF